MKAIALQVAKRLSSLPGADFEENSQKFKLIAKRGVRWRRGTKWGNVHFDRSDCLYIALDYPTNQLNEHQLQEALRLELRRSRSPQTGFYVTHGSPFDSLRITLSRQDRDRSHLEDGPVVHCAEHIVRLASN